MNRFHLSSSIAVTILVAAFIVNGCKAPTVDYQISQFATIRVMDFAPYGTNCSPVAPMDVFWYQNGQPQPTQANIYNLSYGGASVYTNLLQPGNYNVLVTPHLIKSSDLQTSVTLAGNQKYSLVITRPAQSGQFNSMLIQDGVPNPAGNMTYVRFMNMQPGVGSLTVHVDDAISGDVINSTPEAFGQVSAYTALKVAQDTSYAFLVTDSSGRVISRLAFQTFTGGNCYTLVYAGDLCQTLATNAADSTQSANDTLRLRAFDDNNLGNDQTNPPLASFRYNIVNDICPTSHSFTQDSVIGFLVNGQGFQEFGNGSFSLPPIHAYQGGGENVPTGLVNGAYEVHYQSAIVPKPMNIQGFLTNASGSTQQTLFNAGNTTYPLTEPAAFLASSGWNKPWTILFYDTIPSAARPNVLDTTLSQHFAIVQVPDTISPDEVTLFFVSGIVAQPPNKTNSLNYSSFYAQSNGGSLVPAPRNGTTGILSGTTEILQFSIPAGTSAPFTVVDSIGNKSGASGNRVFGGSSTFTAQAGGIYEVVSTGTKVDPHLLIMHVNGQ